MFFTMVGVFSASLFVSSGQREGGGRLLDSVVVVMVVYMMTCQVLLYTVMKKEVSHHCWIDLHCQDCGEAQF